MAALAGVPADGVGKLVYPDERPQERAGEDGVTRWAACCVVASGLELIDLAKGAAERVTLGGYTILHLLSTFPC